MLILAYESNNSVWLFVQMVPHQIYRVFQKSGTPVLILRCFVTTLLRHIVFMRDVFCFNGFNQTAIVLRYSAHIKPRIARKTIKTIKTESNMLKKNMTVSSHSIAVNK